ncbi:hypothetical protein ON010_g12221 [Phytophthora cinnamomi]|nr:hypothetical protein ON010_g12221 [Phytophthora cinnamomi]
MGLARELEGHHLGLPQVHGAPNEARRGRQGAAHVHVPHRDEGPGLDGAVRSPHVDRQEGHAEAEANVAARRRLQLWRLLAGEGGTQRPVHALPVPRRRVFARDSAVDGGLRLLRALGGHRVSLVREAEGGVGARLEPAVRNTAAVQAPHPLQPRAARHEGGLRPHGPGQVHHRHEEDVRAVEKFLGHRPAGQVRRERRHPVQQLPRAREEVKHRQPGLSEVRAHAVDKLHYHSPRPAHVGAAATPSAARGARRRPAGLPAQDAAVRVAVPASQGAGSESVLRLRHAVLPAAHAERTRRIRQGLPLEQANAITSLRTTPPTRRLGVNDLGAAAATAAILRGIWPSPTIKRRHGCQSVLALPPSARPGAPFPLPPGLHAWQATPTRAPSPARHGSSSAAVGARREAAAHAAAQAQHHGGRVRGRGGAAGPRHARPRGGAGPARGQARARARARGGRRPHRHEEAAAGLPLLLRLHVRAVRGRLLRRQPGHHDGRGAPALGRGGLPRVALRHVPGAAASVGLHALRLPSRGSDRRAAEPDAHLGAGYWPHVHGGEEDHRPGTP